MIEIKNDKLKVEIQEKGAELWSIKDSEGNEYLWQGDSKYWSDRALNIFPYIARMTEGKYVLDGETYEMDIHGFAKDTVFCVQEKGENRVVFIIHSTDESYRQYPYRFEFAIAYELEESKLSVTYMVRNKDDKTMYFAVGGHPGFNVPLEKDTVFEDYYLEFDSVQEAKRVIFSEDCFVLHEDGEFSLENGRCLPLQHQMFDDDAIVLRNMAKGVRLTSAKSKKAIHVEYPDMSYIGFWHRPRTDAPYICIEPWSSLPSRKGIVEDLETQPGLISLKAGKEYKNRFVIEIEG